MTTPIRFSQMKRDRFCLSQIKAGVVSQVNDQLNSPRLTEQVSHTCLNICLPLIRQGNYGPALMAFDRSHGRLKN
jgi:hypothetical protein